MSDILLDNERFNAEVKRWGKATVDEQKVELTKVGVKEASKLIRQFNVRFGLNYGRVNRITFGFPRYLVHLEKGSGRGYGGRKGSRWETHGKLRRTAKSSLGKMNTGARIARPTFNPLMDRRVPILVAKAAEFYAEMAVKNSLAIK